MDQKGYCLAMRIQVRWILATALLAGCINQIPKKSAERQTDWNLSGMRSAIRMYYDDTHGHYPTDLAILIRDKKYLAAIPYAMPAKGEQMYHSKSNDVKYFSSGDQSDDSGGWGYVNNPKSPDFGKIFVNCTHQDARRISWNQK
jgi:hypothetical protein